jgi:2-amino-4-hydroxy-6-hydroxymethyldihydropteridine diphosphokinase / dihydropteroate synthase
VLHKVYLGLGSNLGDSNKNILTAINLLKNEFSSLSVSPLFKTPPHLPRNAPESWNRSYLNCAVECYSDHDLKNTWQLIKKIELNSGRISREKWSPRVIDIDFLLYDQEVIASNDLELTLPHSLMDQRSFVLRPLSWLSPSCMIPGTKRSESVLTLTRRLNEKLPIWMSILNITPDSFSDGENHQNQEMLYLKMKELILQGTHIIDIGAESTRPGATILTDQDEWERLVPVFEVIDSLKNEFSIMPKISIDTYHHATARKTIDLGIDIINDVSGLRNPKMLSLIKDSDCKWVLMHSLSVPARKDITIPDKLNVTQHVYDWFENRLENLQPYGLNTERVILDPGIGFGKTSDQCVTLINEINQFTDLDCLLMVGHSRKSFMKKNCDNDMKLRDIETCRISQRLIDKGVDIVRIHNLELHQSFSTNNLQ